jgi:heterokaryon incompatibility protein (HET)
MTTNLLRRSWRSSRRSGASGQEPGRSTPSNFSFSPLPDPASIRLIQFVTPTPSSGSRDPDIEFNLSVHWFGDGTPFECLSYTWGNSTFPYSKLAEELEPAYRLDYEIGVNGDVLTVQKNLYDAPKMPRSRIKGRKSSGYFWIDAICINQMDIEEKSWQVAMMDQIYRAATRTIVWVGLEDEFMEDAFSLIKSIGTIPRNRHRPLTIEDFNYRQELILWEMGARP